MHVAWQRVDPRVTISNSVGLVSAYVKILGFSSTDELALSGKYENNDEISGVYSSSTGILSLIRVEGVSHPLDWEDVLRNVQYKLSDDLKPCSAYRRLYWRLFQFAVYDSKGRLSNIFSKGLTVDTGTNLI